MSTPTRRGRPGYDQEQVLLVAARTFTERGYDGTSMDDIAKALGVTKSAIYHHVSGKDELLARATDRALDALSEAVADARAAGGTALEQLERVLRRSVEVLVEQLPYVTVLVRVRGNTTVERRAITRRRAIDAEVAALVTQAQADGALRADLDPDTTARLLFGLVNSLVDWYRPGRRTAERSARPLADTVTSLALDGLRARDTAS